MRHIFKISILLFLFCCAAKADTTASQAEELYRSGDWKKAAEAYKGLTEASLKEGKVSAPLLYNYGTALAKAGSIGEAYVVFWKAFYLAPLDGDIRFNLTLAETKLPEALKSVKPATWFSWWPKIAQPFSFKIWLCIALLFSAVLIWLLKVNAPSAPKMSCGAVLLIFLGLSLLSFYQNNEKAAGLMSTTKIRSGPNDSFPEITTLDTGSLVNLEEMRDGWYKIRFQSAQNQETVGWIPSATVLEIN